MPEPERRIKVLVLSASLGKGGTERVFSLLLEHFDRERFAPELAIFHRPIDYPVPVDTPVHVITERSAPKSPIEIPVPDALAREHAELLAWMPAATAQLAELVDELRPDVVLASPLWASIMALVAAPRFPRSTRLASIAGAPPAVWLANHPHKGLFEYLLRENLPRQEGIVAVSRGVAADLASNFGVDPSLVRVIETPVDVAGIERLAAEAVEDEVFADGTPVVLSVGRLERVKGTEYLLRAIARVAGRRRVRCVIVGEGSQHAYLEALAKHLGIEDMVRFAGSRDNPFALMRQATIFVMPSLSEGLPNALLEAMACGCPVIATDIEGGVTRDVLLDGECGVIVPREDDDALADAIADLLDDGDKRERLAQAARQRVEDFGVERVVHRFEDFLTEVAHTQVRGSRAELPDKLRVLVLVSEMSAGGAQRFVSTLLRHMDRRQFEPYLAAVTGTRMEFSLPDDVPVTVVSEEPLPPERDYELAARVRQELGSDAAWMEEAVARVGRVVRRLDPDVVLCSPEYMTVLAAAASRHFSVRTRLIGRIGALPSIAFADSERAAVYAVLARAYFEVVDRFVAVSSVIRDELIWQFGVEAERISLIHNPVDLATIQEMAAEPAPELESTEGSPLVAFVGRLDRVKAIDVLLRALDRVRPVHPVRCVIVGEGTQEPYLRALSKHLGLGELVQFVGTQRNPFRFLSRADVFVLPSISEGMPNVLLEAMACGCPVVATDIEGGVTREILEDGEDGLIVPVGDEDALAEALLHLFNDETERQRLRERGYARAREFDLHRIVGEIETLLQEVAGSPGMGTRPAAALPGPAVTSSTVDTTAPMAPLKEETRPAATPPQLASAASVERSPARIALDRVRAAVHRARRRFGTTPPQLARAQVEASRRQAGKRGLLLVVSSVGDPVDRLRAEAVLRHADRHAFEVSLVRVFDQPDAGAVPDDVIQYVLEASAPAVAPADVDSVPAGAHRQALEWLTAMAGGLVDLAGAAQSDVVVGQGFLAATIVGMAAADLSAGTATVASLSMGGSLAGTGIEHGELYDALLREHLRSVSLVFAPDEHVAEELEKEYGIDPARVAAFRQPTAEVRLTLPSGVQSAPDRHEWFEAGAHAVVSVVDREAPETVEKLLRAIEVVRRVDDMRCVVLGVDERRDEWRALACELGIGEAVGFVEEADALEWYLSHAVACVNLSRSTEAGVPHQVLLATAVGCPVVSTRGSDATFTYLGEGSRCLLVAKGDSESIGESVLALVWDQELGARVAALAKAYFDSRSPDSVVRQFDERILDVLRPSGPAA